MPKQEATVRYQRFAGTGGPDSEVAHLLNTIRRARLEQADLVIGVDDLDRIEQFAETLFHKIDVPRK